MPTDLQQLTASWERQKATYEGRITDLQGQLDVTQRALSSLSAMVVSHPAEQCVVAPEGPQDPAGWTLVQDVDLTKDTGWRLETGGANNTNSYDLPRNVSFSDAGLRIVGKREPTPNGRPFSTGDARGEHIAIPNHCRVEVTGRGPHATGLWPCVLWLRPLSGSDGEIDLMENFGGQPRVKATLHNEYGSNHKMIGRVLPWDKLDDPDPAALHTYVLEKTPNRIKITADGVTLMDVGPADAPAGFDWQRIMERERNWYPRVTLQIGNGPANPNGATGTPDPSFQQTDMLVTSLKIYKPAG